MEFHHNWYKQCTSIKPYHIFLSGPGGMEKSHVIKTVHSDTIRFLKMSGAFEPDEVVVLVTVPTGVAAFNIDGMTLHSALQLGCKNTL